MKFKTLFIIFILFVPFVYGVIREGSCNPDETCLLSTFQMNNSHIGVCDYYNHSLCVGGSRDVNLREGGCSLGEYCILSQFQENNSHVGRCDYYNYSLCISGSWNITLVDGFCSPGDTFITFFQENNSHIGNLYYYNYSLCLEDITLSDEPSTGGPSTGGSGRSERKINECEKDDDCSGDYVCYDYKCVKLFDVKILKVDSPIKPEGFFSFIYYIKGMADFSSDVIVDFWLEDGEGRLTSGADTIYLGTYEEKTEEAELYLPSDIEDGLYKFYVQVSFEGYKARSIA